MALILLSVFFAIPLVYADEPEAANFNNPNIRPSPALQNALQNPQYVVVPENPVQASDNKGNLTGPAAAVVTVLAWIIYPFAYAAGLLLTFLIWMFIEVIQYNHFIDVDTVVKGWVIIRDLCNMLFVLVLLTVAFATILRVESYQLKKILPKLIIAAVLINFSRTIFGLIIDFGQVVMMTFVSGFSQFGASEFVKAFQINEYLSFADTHTSTESVGVLATLGALIAGFAALLITLVVIIVFLAIIVMRIIMLWVYTILSPLVFLGYAFPAAQKYTQQIWSDFIKQVVTGPLLAFFIWLALTTAQPSAQALQQSWASYNPFGSGNAAFQDQLQQERNKMSGALSSIFTANNFQRYIIVIALLIGGLMVTQQMGGFAGTMAGKGMNWIQSGKGLGMKGLKTAGFWAGRKADVLQMGLQKRIAGKDSEYIPKSLNYRMIAQGWKKQREEVMEKYETAGGAHGSLTWQDTFNKYMKFGQYLGVRKSKSRQTIDNAESAKLRFENTKLQERIDNSKLSATDKKVKLDSLRSRASSIVAEYDAHNMNGQIEFQKDIHAMKKIFDRKSATEHISKNTAQAEFLSGEFRLGGWAKLPGAAPRADMKYSKSGAKEIIEKREKEMSRRTDGEHSAVVSELLEAIKNNDMNDIAAAFRILAQNNDLNEALKDNRVVNLMTKQNGIMEKLATNMKLDTVQTQKLLSDFRSNPVTPAYAQAMIQGMFKDAGLGEGMAARNANEIGNITISKGNGIGYAMSDLDLNSGNYKFDKLAMEDGKLSISEDRQQAIVGKLNNIESQLKIRTLHPDTIIAEASDGRGAYL
ncbi:MAG: hypothetical protein AAB956_01510, partial [Patescibacteria group bacterium]